MPNDFLCSTNDNCESGWCDGRHTYGCHGTCKPKVPDNQFCRGLSDGNSCISGQCTCNKCGKKLANGQKCSTNDNCASGWCDSQTGVTYDCRGTCTNKVPYGHECRNGNDVKSCSQGQCTCGYCGRKLPAGYDCATNDNCVSGSCGGWFTVGCKGKCK